LARELHRHGAEIAFACRVQDFDVATELSGSAFALIDLDWSLEPDQEADELVRIADRMEPDTIIVDHYHAGPQYQERLSRARVPWLQFDRRAGFPLLAKWVLNPSPAARVESYRPLTRGNDARLLLGPKYALLRPEFESWARCFQVREAGRRVLLAFGGGDDRGAARIFLQAMSTLDSGVSVSLLTSRTNPRLAEIRRLIEEERLHRVELWLDEREVARRMVEADVAIVSAGTLAFETATIGLPTLLTAIADNQEPIMKAWKDAGATHALGPIGSVSVETAAEAVRALLADEGRRRELSEAGRRLVDGRGAIRVANELVGLV
jgi:spore coat polysaccharide biosynthesis predicted glycosyltransferase SpsG